MSWNVSFTLTRDDEGKAVVTVGTEFGAPEGSYTVSGHTLANDRDWGESIGVATPVGYTSSTISNPHTRGVARLARPTVVNDTDRECIALDVNAEYGGYARVLLAPEDIQEVVDALVAQRDQVTTS